MPSAPTVVIDPGHGGSAAVGGSSPNNATGPNGLLEKDVTLDLSRRVAEALTGRAAVVLTRTGDENHSLSQRARVAHDADADAFVSIHLNGWKDPGVDGSEAWVARHAGDNSRRLARSVLDRVVSVTGVRDRGVQEADFGVLLPVRHAPRTAATLVEVAFLTNLEEAHRLEDDGYRQSIAAAIADGVVEQLAANGTAQALGTSPVSARPTTIFLPGQTGGYEDYVQPATKGDLLPLLNGRSWNPAEDLTEPLDQMQTFVQAAGEGDHVYLAAWYFEPATSLTLGSYTSPAGPTAANWGELFAAKAAEGVSVRILQTDFDPTFFKDSHDVLRNDWYAEVDRQIGSLPADKQDNLKYVISLHPAHTNLLRWYSGGDAVFIASHHQKFMVVSRGGETTAFCGGLDIESRKTPAAWRNDGRGLAGWHDIHVRLQGPVARDLEREFALRWNREKDASQVPARPGWSGYEALTVPDPPGEEDADAAAEKQIEDVQMLRTVSVDGGWTSAYDNKRDDVKRVYDNVVRSAESFLYFENQYFRSLDLADAVAAAGRDNESLIAIFVVVQSAGADDGTNPVTQHGDNLERKFFERVADAMGDRARFYTMQWRAVHSKFLLADDRWMTIGSANANDRSFLLDSELNVAVDDTKLTGSFRRRLWARNLGVPEADVATWNVPDYLDRWSQIATANQALFGTARDVAAIEAIPGECIVPFDWTTLPSDTVLPVPDVLATIDFDPRRDEPQTAGGPASRNGDVPTAAAALDTAVAAVGAGRPMSPMHARLANEPWTTDPTVLAALSAAGATMQPIADGVGDVVYDEYTVTIDAMPPGLSPEAFFAEFAADPNATVANPAFDTENVFTRRPTGSPPALGDIYDIDLAGPDNGSVVVVELAPDHVVFQTISTKFAETGSHPECGARAFGVERNADGSVTFYTRGASRIAPAIAAAPGGATVAATLQERSWTQMMIGISGAIQNRGGTPRPSSFTRWSTVR
jgi:N-acetylmuramoyl-L-alanine amidase/phosphatidylserine/phosphatidylglycerophosphate/cardiolipin synthase-like enzyme